MSAKRMVFTEQVGGPAEVIFDLVADMPNYGKWLPDSAAFGGTVDVTPYPVRLGTTYLDAGPVLKPGVVTEFERPRHLGFHHTVQIRQWPLKTDVDVRIRYTFTAKDGGTLVERVLEMEFALRGVLKWMRPLLIWGFRRENVRTMAALKRYVEGGAATG